MPKREVLKNNEKELTTKCEQACQTDKNVIEDMLETFKSSVYGGWCIGVGLSANQIGHMKRVILVSPTAKHNDITIMCNPIILRHGKEVEFLQESCLSYPNKRSSVGRYRVIDVEYFDENWSLVKATLKGLVARIVQHEIDHLNGLDCLENRL
jgi:peptide deformylase